MISLDILRYPSLANNVAGFQCLPPANTTYTKNNIILDARPMPGTEYICNGDREDVQAVSTFSSHYNYLTILTHKLSGTKTKNRGILFD